MNYIGIDIGATNLKAGLVDDRGRILATQKMKIVQIESPDALARNLARMTQELAEEVGVPMEEIFSIGVGVPGVVTAPLLASIMPEPVAAVSAL